MPSFVAPSALLPLLVEQDEIEDRLILVFEAGSYTSALNHLRCAFKHVADSDSIGSLQTHELQGSNRVLRSRWSKAACKALANYE